MPITQLQPDLNQNISQAPTLGMMSGTLGSGGQQRRNVSQKGSGFTNLQQYVTANEGNRNPQIIAQRQQQANTALGQAQQGFQTQAETAKTGLEGIQGTQQFVQNAITNPTDVVKTPENLARFTALRKGEESIANPTDIYNQYNLAKTGLQSQQQNLGTGLQRDVTTNLQDYIKSKRLNPELATQGENILDRFLTESTQSGQNAIQSAIQRSNAIQQAQIPTVANQVETLRSQLSPNYLNSADIQNAINTPAQAEENYLKNLDKNYLIEKAGLSGNTRSNNYNDYIDAQAVQNNVDKYNQRINDLNTKINSLKSDLTQGGSISNFDGEIIGGSNLTGLNAPTTGLAGLSNISDQYNQLQKYNSEKSLLQKGLDQYISNKDNSSLLNKLQNYNSQLGKSKQQLLSQYDPSKLARINALASLSGMNYNDLLGQVVQ